MIDRFPILAPLALGMIGILAATGIGLAIASMAG